LSKAINEAAIKLSGPRCVDVMGAGAYDSHSAVSKVGFAFVLIIPAAKFFGVPLQELAAQNVEVQQVI
jgi:hypothetical protein